MAATYHALPPMDRERLQVWNDTRDVAEAFVPAPELVRVALLASPDAIAVADAGVQLTRAAFARRVRYVARNLRRVGIGPEIVVGVLMDRSAEMVVVIHAIVQSGGAYAPLDPDSPAARAAELLATSRAAMVVVDRRHHDAMTAYPAIATFLAEDLLLDCPEAPRRRDIDPEQAAYVICTSGSTGRPKAVVNRHAALTNRLRWTQAYCPLGGQDVVLHKTPVSFDVSVWELFWPLIAGAKLVVTPGGSHKETKRLASLIRAQGVTLCHFVPALLKAWLEEPEAGGCRSLRHVIASGEELHPVVARTAHEMLGVRLHNLYGPTEAAIDVTAWEYEPGILPARLPIGRPITNVQIHVLDRESEFTMIGQPGELFIAGSGLARGYAGQPAMTAAAFLPSIDDGAPGQRMYRTGDIGCWAGSGMLEYHGRTDAHVKLRGMRIDLAEIEAVLHGHASVRAAVVRLCKTHRRNARVGYSSEWDASGRLAAVRPFLRGVLTARQDGAEESVLAAWIEPCADGAQPTADDLRGWLAARLPAHCTPALWTFVDAMPRSSNGKVDRASFASPDASGDGARRSPPRTQVEVELASIWAQVLEVPNPGILDNFFELGGDSLVALRVAGIAASRGIAVDVATLLAHPTIQALACHVSVLGLPFRPAQPFDALTEPDRARLPPGVTDAYPLTAIQAGLVYHDEADAQSEVYKEVFVYRVRGPLSAAALADAAAAVTAQHEIMRTSIDLDTFSVPMQLVHAGATATVELDAMPDGHRPASVEEIAKTERCKRFAWSRPPLARFRVRPLEDGTFELFLIFHDLLLDGWSASLLVVELLRRYDAVLSGIAMPHRSLPRSRFADYVRAEADARCSSASHAFFAGMLDGRPPQQFPVHAGAAGAGRFQVLDVPIPQTVSANLKRAASLLGISLKHVLLAVHMRALGHLFGTRDVLTGLEIHGRIEQPEADRVLGMHLNTAPFRMKLAGGSWRELARLAAAAEQAVWPHRRYPYAVLKARYGDVLQLETVFNYVHFHVFQELGGLREIQLVDAFGYGASHFPFRAEFSTDPFSGRVHLCLECNVERLGAAVVADAGRCYERLLADIAFDIGGRYDRPGLIEPEAAAGTANEATEQTWLSHLAEQARRCPDRVAVNSRPLNITYRALWARARAASSRLMSMGVEPETIVALRFNARADEIITMVAVHLAGGAYMSVPHRPPPQGVQALLDASGAAWLVSDSNGPVPSRVQSVDPAWLLGESARRAAPRAVIKPAALAYVMYTSGSTGTPRGVGVSHANMRSSVDSRLAYYAETDERTHLLVPATSSDSSVAVIFWSLAAGGRLVLARPSELASCAGLARVIRREAVTDMLLTPSLYSLLLAEEDARDLASLRRVVVAGEVAHAALQVAHQRGLPETALFNEYGPTEAAVWSTVAQCEPGADVVGGLPIGRACRHCRVDLLDAFDLPAMAGQCGEIVIGGSGIARGYLGQPSATASRFVPDPREHGGRGYRSGDLARRSHDGILHFVGRNDRQVKVNGFRLELAEVENALLGCAGVRQAAVMATVAGERMELTAFVAGVGVRDPDATLDELRTTLARHAVPGRCLWLDDLPKTGSGKIDYRDLERRRPELIVQARLDAALGFVEKLDEAEVEMLVARGEPDPGYVGTRPPGMSLRAAGGRQRTHE